MPPKQSEPDGNSAPSSPLSPAASNTPLNGVHNGSPSAVQIDYQIGSPGKPMIDPELADLPPPPHHHMPEDDALPVLTREPGQMSITESIAQAPNPKPADFSMLPITNEDMDLTTLDPSAMDGPPGSPSARLLKAIAPPNAAQPDSKWQPPPPNSSVNLFIGRALLANGNDNWPLKPNDIVNFIRKHYPAEWDGDEGRCSAHRVRTYLARKGTDMYYEKLNQGCIAGWRIRQNHLWRFENGGFLGRGMKQEEALAAQAKENEATMTANHKAAAAQALAAGHPGIRVSMSVPGVSEGAPPMPKRPRPNKPIAAVQPRKKTVPRAPPAPVHDSSSLGQADTVNLAQAAESFYNPANGHVTYGSTPYDPNSAGPSSETVSATIDPSLDADHGVDMDLVQRAMQAAAANVGQMEDLEMGMQLPIEMQIHGGEHDDSQDWGTGAHPYTPHGSAYGDGQYGFTSSGGDGQVYGQ